MEVGDERRLETTEKAMDLAPDSAYIDYTVIWIFVRFGQHFCIGAKRREALRCR
jgi:hypothetical protein